MEPLSVMAATAVILGLSAAVLTNDQLHDCERNVALIQATCGYVRSLAEKWSVSAGVGFFAMMLVEVAALLREWYRRFTNPDRYGFVKEHVPLT